MASKEDTTEIKDWFQQLFDRQYSGMCNYAFAFVRDADSAQDIVQAVFLSIWENRGRLFQSEKIDAFLIKSVKNRSIDYLRKQKRTQLEEEVPAAYAATPPAEIEEPNEDKLRLLAIAIEQLPPKTKQAFLMSRKEGLTYKEIAEELKISVKTVENQIGRALRHLRGFFEGKNV